MEYSVNNIDEFLSCIKKIKNQENDSLLWFRGHNRSYYNLQPSLLRYAIQVTNSVCTPIAFTSPNYNNGHGETLVVPPIKKTLESFKSLFQNNEYCKLTIGKPENDLDWYFLAQHYGIPTTLLDWSEDPFIALFFSLYEYDENDTNVTIYVFSPNNYNREVSKCLFKETIINEPLTINEQSLNFLLKYLNTDDWPYFPICIKPNIKDYRIIRQSGNFIIHGCNFQPLDLQYFNYLFHKIYIPKSAYNYFNNILNILQLNDKVIYGLDKTLDKESKKIKAKAQKQFADFIQDLHKELTPPPFSFNH